jgi:hypothetical protein
MNFELVPNQTISMTTGATIHTTNVTFSSCPTSQRTQEYIWLKLLEIWIRNSNLKQYHAFLCWRHIKQTTTSCVRFAVDFYLTLIGIYRCNCQWFLCALIINYCKFCLVLKITEDQINRKEKEKILIQQIRAGLPLMMHGMCFNMALLLQGLYMKLSQRQTKSAFVPSASR